MHIAQPDVCRSSRSLLRSPPSARRFSSQLPGQSQLGSWRPPGCAPETTSRSVEDAQAAASCCHALCCPLVCTECNSIIRWMMLMCSVSASSNSKYSSERSQTRSWRQTRPSRRSSSRRPTTKRTRSSTTGLAPWTRRPGWLCLPTRSGGSMRALGTLPSLAPLLSTATSRCGFIAENDKQSNASRGLPVCSLA